MRFEKLKNIDEIELNKLYTDFEKIIIVKSFPKNHILHKEGNICNHLFLIEKGIARSYYFKDGKDITAYFALENEILTAIDSFVQQKKK